jgi:hypothetical protein
VTLFSAGTGSGPKGQVTIIVGWDEWLAMQVALGAAGQTLSEATHDALSNAQPRGLGLVVAVTCTDASARELLAARKTAAGRRAAEDPATAALLERAARSIDYARWKRPEEPPPDAVRSRRS